MFTVFQRVSSLSVVAQTGLIKLRTKVTANKADGQKIDCVTGLLIEKIPHGSYYFPAPKSQQSFDHHCCLIVKYIVPSFFGNELRDNYCYDIVLISIFDFINIAHNRVYD